MGEGGVGEGWRRGRRGVGGGGVGVEVRWKEETERGKRRGLVEGAGKGMIS